MITCRTGLSLIWLISVFTCWSFVAQAQGTSFQDIEVLDATTWDFSKRLPLSGNWSFVENKLVSPDAVGNENLTTSFFPSLWNDYRPDGRGTGYATYALNILIPDSLKFLALEIPALYTSYNMWVNGNLIASAGTVGVDKEATIPKWVYQAAYFSNTKDTIQIVLQMANFHHYKGGGGRHPIFLGTSDRIQSQFNWSVGSNVFGAAVLFLEGIIFLFVYCSKKKTVVLYFALLCLTWSVRSIFSNLYPLILAIPDFSWQWVVKIEYITLYLTTIWAALFFHSLFRDISNAIFTYLPVGINLFFVVFTLLTSPILFTRYVSIYLGVAIVVIVYGTILIVRALIIDREGSWFLMSTIWIGVLIFGYDIVAYQIASSSNVVFLNIGYVVIFMLTTVALLYHLRIFKNKTEEKTILTMKDIYHSGKR
jgi:hypothetical protein